MTAPPIGKPIANPLAVGSRSSAHSNAEHQSWSDELARAQLQHLSTNSHAQRQPRSHQELQSQKMDVARACVVDVHVQQHPPFGEMSVAMRAGSQPVSTTSSADSISDHRIGRRIHSNEATPKGAEHARGHRVTAHARPQSLQRSHGQSDDKPDPAEQARLAQQMIMQITLSTGLPAHAVRVVSLESLAATGIECSRETVDPAPHRRRSEETPRPSAAPHVLTISDRMHFAQQGAPGDSVSDSGASESQGSRVSLANELQPIPESIRLHANWSAEGVRLWLGMDSSAQAALQPIATQLQRWLNNQGHKLLALNCNGQVVIDDANQPSHTTKTNIFSTSSHHFKEAE